jgi:hypothetical protein
MYLIVIKSPNFIFLSLNTPIFKFFCLEIFFSESIFRIFTKFVLEKLQKARSKVFVPRTKIKNGIEKKYSVEREKLFSFFGKFFFYPNNYTSTPTN